MTATMQLMQPSYVQPTPAQRVVVIRPVRHSLHLVMSLLTGGLWIAVWVVAVMRHREKIRGAW